MAIFHGEKIKLFALSSNQPLAQEISEYIGVPLSHCEVSRFQDGEIGIDITETVRGHKVFVIQATNNPVNENLMELLIFVDALKRASAREINAIIPYYGYSRQDRKVKSRQPISAKLVADLLQTAGVNRVICLDLHAGQIQGFFNIPIDNLRSMPVITKYIRSKKLKEVVVVSPDHGGAARARTLGDKLNAPIAIIDKRRPRPNVAEIMNIIGDVEGKDCVMIDDMVDTGGTIVAGAKALKKAGAKDIYVCCTHPLLSGNAVENLSNLDVIKEFVCTNSILIPEEKKFPNLVQLSIGPLIGEAIINIIDAQPLSPLFEGKDS